MITLARDGKAPMTVSISLCNDLKRLKILSRNSNLMILPTTMITPNAIVLTNTLIK
jgi:hypothetical protein